MSETLFKEVRYDLNSLVKYIEIGDIGLPDIQRPFVWKNSKVRDLFDSMYRGYPIGYLLFWQNMGDPEEVIRSIGTDQKQRVARFLIVDGQQRLTSLYAVVKGIPVVREGYDQEHIHIAFRPTDGKFEVTDAAIKKDPEFLPNISTLWATGIDLFEVTDGYLQRLRESREVSDEEVKVIRRNLSGLSNLMTFPFTALEISSTVNEEQVSEIFVRINSKGTPLKQADFILTLMSVFWDEGRADLERFCQQARKPTTGQASPFNYFIEPDPDQMLRVSVGLGFRRAKLQYVYSILRGKDLETEKFSEELREKQFGVLREAQAQVLNLQYWHDFLKVLLQAGFRSGKMISSKNNLLFAYILYLIGKKQFAVDPFDLKKVIARWFFMSSLTGRYTDSPESQMESDLADLREITQGEDFIAHLNKVSRDTFTEDFWNITLANDLATSSPRSPSLLAYYAALNLLEARVLFSKNRVSDLLDPSTKAHRSAIERHHLFPKAYLKSIGIKQIRDTNQIANFALLEWDDNDRISKQPPSDYYPRYASRFSSEDLEKMRYWHALPEGWEHMKYQDFLEARRSGIAKVIRAGFKLLDDHTPVQ